ncbi:putative FCP1 homology domain-containing protein C1271.03c [Tasmannia lanceolata]|uniref:putative FCP1 homology domain-containing protein C1271.03c n=1 Tax=Tasmannia lanceolata TaxID=3420 RepID=UPI004063F686
MDGKMDHGKLKMAFGTHGDDDGEEEREDYDVGLPLEKLSMGPRKKLLVIDLNGLIADTFFPSVRNKIPKHRRPDGSVGKKLVYNRPFCVEFLKFCFERFDVGIWSSAKTRNVDGAITFVMGVLRRRLVFTWDQSKCTETGLMTLENKEKPIFLKELRKLWDKVSFDLPWPKGRYSSSNTLLIEDDPYKALLNPPNTAIFPHPYKAEAINDNFLAPGEALWVFLDGLAEASDVPSYV